MSLKARLTSPLVVLIACLIVPVGMVLWSVVNEEWGVLDDDSLHPFDDLERVYLSAGRAFGHERDLYWINLDEWPSTEAYYYSPLFAGGMRALEAVLPDSAISFGAFILLLIAYILGTRLWWRELHQITGIALVGALPIFIFYTTESVWANLVLANVVIGLYALLALTVWAGREQRAGVAALALILLVIAKPQFIFGAGTAVLLAWHDPGGRAFVQRAVGIAVALGIAALGAAALATSPGYVIAQSVDWARFLLSASRDYPYIGSDEFWTANNSLAQQLHRIGAEELLPLVFALQLLLLADFVWRLYRAFRSGAGWQSNPRQALAFVLWGYLLVGLFAHVFMDLIAGPVVYYFLVGTHLVTRRWEKIALVALIMVVTVSLFMSVGGLLPCYLIFTIMALPRLRRYAGKSG
jgi:hypothetical protein